MNSFSPCFFSRICSRIVMIGSVAFSSMIWANSVTDVEQSVESFLELPLADLLSVEVTSVAKKRQRLSDAATAISVITKDDIRRTGVDSIPEALRMVAGLQVASIDANKWTVSARGFSGIWSNKLLVLMDGRSLYTPLFGGVYWDVQDTIIEDIERIEVIRGPGATLWGSNAVNGVINIITKPAGSSQGGLAVGGFGDEQRFSSSLRYGGRLGQSAHYRIYGKSNRRDNGQLLLGLPAEDASEMKRVGFRIDWPSDVGDALTLQGEMYRGSNDWLTSIQSISTPMVTMVTEQEDLNGWHLQGQWQKSLADDEYISLQAYLDHTERNPVFLKEIRDTLDFEFQHRFSVNEAHEIIWGLGYRESRDEIRGSFGVTVVPELMRTPVYSGFLQDEIALVPDRFLLTLGTKVEHNEYTGFEHQPSVRLLWAPDQRQSLWASLSKAVRTPSRFERSGRIQTPIIPQIEPVSPGMAMGVFGNEHFDSERVFAHEMGYRLQSSEQLSWDVALFYNDYDNLRGESTGSPLCLPSATPPPCTLPDYLVNPYIELDNSLDGESMGLELTTRWQPTEWWRLQGSYSYLKVTLHSITGGRTEVVGEGSSPQHQWSLRSSMELGQATQVNLWMRYVDELPALEVEQYFTLDARLSWRPLNNLELSLVGKNLLDSSHLEYREQQLSTFDTEVERSVYAQLRWEF